MKLLSFIKKNWIIILILSLGLFLRLYKSQEMFMYGHDQDLAGWIIKDVVVDKHIRLIGQMTSTHGVFIGPLFYYMLIPFYLIFNMDPIGGVYMVAILGALTAWSFYFVLSRILNRKVGLVGAFVYAISPYTVFTDREVVPTMLLIIWSVWFLFSLFLILKKDQKKGFILAAILLALTWHINLGLLILTPVYIVVLLISKTKIDFKFAISSLLIFIVLSLPLILFELRHNFSQTNSIILSFTSDQGDIYQGISKVGKIYDVITKSISRVVWGTPANIPVWLAPILILFLGTWSFVKNKYDRKILILIGFWFLITAGFFSIYSKPVSEYYLNSLTVIWILLMSVLIEKLLSTKHLRYIGYLVIFLFSLVSLHNIFTYPINRSGYLERKEVVNYIKNDALRNEYPCVAVSYIVNPGNDLGYRYFFWLEDMHVEKPIGLAPVYTIVFPHSKVDRMDKTFGALGVINPDYKKYTKKGIETSCSDSNDNIVEPMIGYTD